MIKVDLITGFLGSGKTTFLKKYAKYYTDQGIRIGILENDYGAVNVDMLLLNQLRGPLCELEMVAGGCDADCHKRRFKTKLISMAMSGYKRVLIEPSGLFDMDEFFDTLRDEPLDNWYEIGSVITLVDANQKMEMSEVEEYMLTSQLGHSGAVIISKQDMTSGEQIEATKKLIETISDRVHCKRPLKDLICSKSLEELENADFERLSQAGYQMCDYVKKVSIDESGYETLYFLEHGLTEDQLVKKVKTLFSDASYGDIERVKGFFKTEEGWKELNATMDNFSIQDIAAGQEVIIVIGSRLMQEKIEEYMK